MERQALLAPTTIFDERYEIIALVGSGGMGEVYKAHHRQLDKTVALKILRQQLLQDPDVARRFKHEAQLVSGLRHDHIAQVHTFGVADGQPYIVLDFLEGESLESVLERDGALPPARFLTIFEQVCDALSYAHSKAIIHRDLKPANIFLDRHISGTDKVFLVDFGIAKAIASNDPAAQKMTRTGAVVGTPLYMSPEQCRSEELTRQSDIYALGCVMYHAAFGKPPYSADSAYQLMLQHGYDSVPLDTVPEGYAKDILKILKTAMSKSMDSRYQSVENLQADLLRFKAGEAVQGERLSLKQPGEKQAIKIPKWVRQNAVTISVLALATVGIGAYVYYDRAIDTQVRRLQSHHDYAQFYKSVQREAQTNAAKSLALVDEALPDLMVSQSPDAVRTLLSACGLKFTVTSNYRSMSSYVHAAGILLKDMPSEQWRRQDSPLPELATKIAVYRVTPDAVADELAEGFAFARGLSALGDPLPSIAVANAEIKRLRDAREKKLRIPMRRLVEILYAEDNWENIEPQVSKDILLAVDDDHNPQIHWLVASKLAAMADRCGDPNLGRGLHEEALRRARAVRILGWQAESLQSLADDVMLSGNRAVALSHYRQLLELLPRIPADGRASGRFLRLGESFYCLQQPKETDKCLHAAVAQTFKDIQYLDACGGDTTAPRVTAHWSQGLAYLLLGQPLDAQHAFERAKQIKLQSATFCKSPVWSNLAAACAVLQQSNHKQPGEAVLPAEVMQDLVLASWHLQRSDYKSAGRSFASMARAGTQYSPVVDLFAMDSAAELLAHERDFKTAAFLYKTLLHTHAADQSNLAYLSRAAECDYHSGDFKSAREEFKKVLDQTKKAPRQQADNKVQSLAYTRLGEFEMQDGNYSAAVDDFNDAFKVAQNEPFGIPFRTSSIRRMDAYRAMGNYDAAKKAANELLAIELKLQGP